MAKSERSVRSGARRRETFRLGGQEAPREEKLGDLNGVQGRALAEVVADAPEREPVLDGGIAPDPPDEHLVLASGVSWRWKLGEAQVRSSGKDVARLLHRQRSFGLQPDRLRVPDQHGHANARRLQRHFGQAQDLARLGAELGLFTEFIAFQLPVHGEVGVGDRCRSQPLDACVARARRGLVSRQAHACDPGGVVQRLENAAELNCRAVRVGDDLVVVENAVIDAGDDERDAVGEAVGVRLVEADGAAAGRLGEELAARLGADREEAEVEIAGSQRVRRGLLDGQLTAAEANAAPGGAR